MPETFDGFEWDEGNRTKCQKHGVSLSEIESVFSSALAVLPDPLHSAAEVRFKAIGKTEAGRFVLIVFTRRDARIRPISARYMHKPEIDYYEKTVARPRDR
jgi:uncharacterized DUF497 family protein